MKYTKVQDFDGTMVFCMKTILSYFEKQRDRILSDYLYILCIPLVKVYGNLSFMIKHPADLIAFFYSLHKVVLDYDPLVDQVVLHNEEYDNEMGQLFFESLGELGADGEPVPQRWYSPGSERDEGGPRSELRWPAQPACRA